MKSIDAESPLKAPNKVWKRKVENLSKKNPSKSRKSENISLSERLVNLQAVQMKALEEAQKMQHYFMKTMLQEQRQMGADERKKDREFLLQLEKLFAQN